jgi:hypothetical protein
MMNGVSFNSWFVNHSSFQRDRNWNVRSGWTVDCADSTFAEDFLEYSQETTTLLFILVIVLLLIA